MLEEGVVGLDTEMGKRIVGLVLRPTEGLIELASGGLDNVQKSYHIYKTENFKNVYISPDMTVEECEEVKKLRAELQRRRSQGEKNIVIRRGKIIINTRNPSPTLNTHNPSPISISN